MPKSQPDLLLLLAQNMETTAKLLRTMAETETESSLTPTTANDGSKKKIMLPTTEEAKRMAAMFSRRLTTPWSDKEITAWRKAIPTMEDIEMVAAYYAAERAKPDGIHRRDLQTCLSNWPGEVDRAYAFAEKRKPAAAGYVDPVQEALRG